jgi:predicted lipoprotein with Yx(FWY)xxD motif
MKRTFLAVFLLLAGCSAGSPPASPSPAPTTAPTAAPTPTFAPTALGTPSATPAPTPGTTAGYSCDPDMGYGCDTPAPTAAATGDTVNVSPDGSYLAGPSGMTLYAFDSDSPDHSACTNPDCTGAWPALAVAAGTSPTAGNGVTGTVTTFDRGNGIMQVEYNGKPLYNFIGDSAPGDTNGTSVHGWHLATP